MLNNIFGMQLSHQIGDAIVVACNRIFAAIEAWRCWRGGKSVKNFSTEELREFMSREDSEFVLVDVRGKCERAVSRIPGSITTEEYESNPQRFLGKTIVPHCTVVGRSYLYARRLAHAGIETRNYRDGILGWCRAELPLETPDGEPTSKVHTYWRIFRVPYRYTFQSKPDRKY
jgi:rhodanese-related sulfurtransferase